MAQKGVQIKLSLDDKGFKTKTSASAKELKRFGTVAQSSSAKMHDYGAATNTAADSTQNFSNHIQRAHAYLGGFALLAAGRGLINYADTWTGLSNKIALVTDSTAQANQVQEELFQIAQRTRTSLEANATLYSRLALGSDDLNYSQTQLLRVTETLNKQVLIGGNNATEASAGLVQFAQGIASGHLQGDELRSVMENLLGVQKGLISGFKKLYKEGQIDFEVTKSNIRDLASTGVLSSDLLIKALLAVTDETDEAFSQLDSTISQAAGRVSNSFLKYIGEANEVSNASGLITGSLGVLADNLDTVINTLTTVGVAYGGLKLATYAQVKANQLFTVSNITSTRSLAGLGAGLTTATVATRTLTVSMHALKAATPFGLAFLALEAAQWAFTDSTEEASIAVDKQTKYLDLYRKSIVGVTQAQEEQNQKKVKTKKLEFDVDIEALQQQLESAIDLHKKAMDKFRAQNPKTDMSADSGYQYRINDIKKIAEMWQGAELAKKQFLDTQAEKNAKKEGMPAELVQINKDHSNLLYELNQENKIAHEKSINAIIAKTNSRYENERLKANKWLATTQSGLDENAQGYDVYYAKAITAHQEWLNKIAVSELENDQKIKAQKLANATDWQSGVTRATNSYYESATNQAVQYENLTTNAFQGMEDALVKFATTGKLSFNELANSIVAGLVRIYIRQQMVSMLGGKSGLLGSLFGGGGKNTSFVPEGGTTLASVRHSGGMAGYSGVTRMVNSDVFNNAKKYHRGGVPGLKSNEVPTILENDEGVFTRKQMQALAPVNNSKQTKGDTIIHVTYAPNLSSLDPSTAAQVVAENAPQIVGIVRQAMGRAGQEANW